MLIRGLLEEEVLPVLPLDAGNGKLSGSRQNEAVAATCGGKPRPGDEGHMTKLSLKRLMRRFSKRTSSIRNPSSPVSSGLVRQPPLRGEPAEVVDQRTKVVVPPRDAEHVGAWGRKKRVLCAGGPRVTGRLGYQHGGFGVRADDSNCLQNKRGRCQADVFSSWAQINAGVGGKNKNTRLSRT